MYYLKFKNTMVLLFAKFLFIRNSFLHPPEQNGPNLRKCDKAHGQEQV